MVMIPIIQLDIKGGKSHCFVSRKLYFLDGFYVCFCLICSKLVCKQIQENLLCAMGCQFAIIFSELFYHDGMLKNFFHEDGIIGDYDCGSKRPGLGKSVISLRMI